MDKQYDIFLSHNSRDKPFVRELAQKLEEHGVIVWLDEREINPGQDWQDAIENALETVKSIAVLISANGLGPWEVPEMRAALVLSVDRSLPVIPILLPGTPQEMKLPLFLRSLTWADLRNGITTEDILRIKAAIENKRLATVKASLLSRQQTTEQVVALTEMEKLYMQVGYWTLRLVLKFVPLLFRSKLPTFHELQTPNPALNQDGPDRPAG